jgi:hypothetical protein
MRQCNSAVCYRVMVRHYFRFFVTGSHRARPQKKLDSRHKVARISHEHPSWNTRYVLAAAVPRFRPPANHRCLVARRGHPLSEGRPPSFHSTQCCQPPSVKKKEVSSRIRTRDHKGPRASMQGPRHEARVVVGGLLGGPWGPVLVKKLCAPSPALRGGPAHHAQHSALKTRVVRSSLLFSSSLPPMQSVVAKITRARCSANVSPRRKSSRPGPAPLQNAPSVDNLVTCVVLAA